MNRPQILTALDQALGRGIVVHFYDGRTMPAKLNGISYKSGEGVFYANVTDVDGYHDKYNVLTIERIEPNGK
jgi:hypothetical protein